MAGILIGGVTIKICQSNNAGRMHSIEGHPNCFRGEVRRLMSKSLIMYQQR